MRLDTRKILNLYGLKFNPFDTDKPTSAIYISERLTKEIWWIENLVMDGGIAAVIGDPGTGKSSFLRFLVDHLEKIPDAHVVHLDRPQSSLGDFYSELGNIFGLDLKVSFRWGSFRTLRKKWSQHIQTTLLRPVLVIDEAQLMNPPTLTELRLLSSEKFDSHKLLTVVLAGNKRLHNKLASPELLPLKSRIRPCITFDAVPTEDMQRMLEHILEKSGNSNLMTDSLIKLLSEHSCGNPRTMMQEAADLLLAAAQQEKEILDESLFYDVCHRRLGKPGKPRSEGRTK